MQLATCESPIGRLGLTVCYDLRFPELYQRLAFDLGAQVLLVPSAFTKLTGLYHSCIIQYNLIAYYGKGSLKAIFQTLVLRQIEDPRSAL